MYNYICLVYIFVIFISHMCDQDPFKSEKRTIEENRK